MNTFDRTVITDKSFGEAVVAIEQKAAEKGFRVLHTRCGGNARGKMIPTGAIEDHRNLQR
ncbi:MAG: hypothetical protein AB1744_02765 [Candidatus Zixiibacteriota bacterium]